MAAVLSALVLAMAAGPWSYVTRDVSGWTVKVRTELLTSDKAGTEAGLKLIAAQLELVAEKVPPKALKSLRHVTVYVSPEYPGVQPRAEYHPGADWLRENGRDPSMVKGVEVTNMRILAKEVDRMPMLMLHELAHAYHDQVLGFEDKDIVAAYKSAMASGVYDRVERWHGTGIPDTFERAYAMTNEREYFAEGTEAYFGRNDFYPFDRADLVKADPGLVKVLERVWLRKGDPSAPDR